MMRTTCCIERFTVLFLTSLLFAVMASGDVSHGKELTLVQDHQSRCVLVVPAEKGELMQVAVDDFCATVKRACNAEIAIVSQGEAKALPKSIVKIVLGPSAMSAALGVESDSLAPEEFRIKTVDDCLVIVAPDVVSRRRNHESMVSVASLGYLLENYVGVRWLWPGELGTVVPSVETIRIPQLDVRQQPFLERRELNLRSGGTDFPALKLWAAHHQMMGQRIDYRFAHSFRKQQMNGDWWGRFHETRPDLLAKGPDGKPGCPGGKTDRVKLCISNPGVTDEILRLWEAAGCPGFWDVTPNDGNCFCTCDRCAALDQEYAGVTYTKKEMWDRPGHVSLTDRYAWFWNQLVRRMREKNPNAKIGVYFYSAYRNPPKRLEIGQGVVGEIVRGWDFKYWKAWQTAGAREIGLRPNWWHMGANAPHLPLRDVGAYVEQARDHDMRWIKMDSLNEYWATQGPFYYLVARLASRPDLTTEDVIDEYCSCFGAASQGIRRYINYWESFHKNVAYNIPAGGSLSQSSDGLYETICRREFGHVLHPLQGHWRTLPLIYTPEALAEGHAMLDAATASADSDQTRHRIAFLRDGLVQLTLTVDVIKKQKEGRNAAIESVSRFTREVEQKYGYWGANGLSLMRHWGAIGRDVNLKGL